MYCRLGSQLETLLVFVVIVNHPRLHECLLAALAVYELSTRLSNVLLKGLVFKHFELLLSYDSLDLSNR